jgi:hypothetical protein
MDGVSALDVLGDPPDPAEAEALEPARKHPTLFELRSGQCRFPLGGLKDPVEFFCGKPALAPRPYCRECCLRAYVVAKKR